MLECRKIYIAVSSAYSLSETANSGVILLLIDLLASCVRIPASEHEVFFSSQRTVLINIIVARSPHVCITPAIKYVKSSGHNRSPCLTPVVKESRCMIPSTPNRTSTDFYALLEKLKSASKEHQIALKFSIQVL